MQRHTWFQASVGKRHQREKYTKPKVAGWQQPSLLVAQTTARALFSVTYSSCRSHKNADEPPAL